MRYPLGLVSYDRFGNLGHNRSTALSDKPSSEASIDVGILKESLRALIFMFKRILVCLLDRKTNLKFWSPMSVSLVCPRNYINKRTQSYDLRSSFFCWKEYIIKLMPVSEKCFIQLISGFFSSLFAIGLFWRQRLGYFARFTRCPFLLPNRSRIIVSVRICHGKWSCKISILITGYIPSLFLFSQMNHCPCGLVNYASFQRVCLIYDFCIPWKAQQFLKCVAEQLGTIGLWLI